MYCLEAPMTVTLCFVSIADVAAIACGREFLVNSSCVLLDTMLHLLGDLKPGQCTKLKVYVVNNSQSLSVYMVLRIFSLGFSSGEQFTCQ
jgi:hypothetical protein